MKQIMIVLLAAAVLFSMMPMSEGFSALAEEKDPFHFATFGEARNAAMMTVGEENARDCVSGEEGYCVALIKQDGRFFRAVTFFDEHANELYSAFLDASSLEQKKFAFDEFRAVEEYLMTLPVQYTEELTVIPLTQEDLDAMAGKTIAEVMSEPWELGMMNYPEHAEENGDVVFPMVKGFCEYELVINEPFEVYQERRTHDHYDPVTTMSLQNYGDLTVRYVRYSGLSDNMLFLSYQADGTWIGMAEPAFVNYDLMTEITDILAAAWENGEPDQETKEAMIAKLTEEHPEAAEMIRQIVESYRSSYD